MKTSALHTQPWQGRCLSKWFRLPMDDHPTNLTRKVFAKGWGKHRERAVQLQNCGWTLAAAGFFLFFFGGGGVILCCSFFVGGFLFHKSRAEQVHSIQWGQSHVSGAVRAHIRPSPEYKACSSELQLMQKCENIRCGQIVPFVSLDHDERLLIRWRRRSFLLAWHNQSTSEECHSCTEIDIVLMSLADFPEKQTTGAGWADTMTMCQLRQIVNKQATRSTMSHFQFCVFAGVERQFSLHSPAAGRQDGLWLLVNHSLCSLTSDFSLSFCGKKKHIRIHWMFRRTLCWRHTVWSVGRTSVTVAVSLPCQKVQPKHRWWHHNLNFTWLSLHSLCSFYIFSGTNPLSRFRATLSIALVCLCINPSRFASSVCPQGQSLDCCNNEQKQPSLFRAPVQNKMTISTATYSKQFFDNFQGWSQGWVGHVRPHWILPGHALKKIASLPIFFCKSDVFLKAL